MAPRLSAEFSSAKISICEPRLCLLLRESHRFLRLPVSDISRFAQVSSCHIRSCGSSTFHLVANSCYDARHWSCRLLHVWTESLEFFIVWEVACYHFDRDNSNVRLGPQCCEVDRRRCDMQRMLGDTYGHARRAGQLLLSV